jgi:hypothetical protein
MKSFYEIQPGKGWSTWIGGLGRAISVFSEIIKSASRYTTFKDCSTAEIKGECQYNRGTLTARERVPGARIECCRQSRTICQTGALNCHRVVYLHQGDME